MARALRELSNEALQALESVRHSNYNVTGWPIPTEIWLELLDAGLIKRRTAYRGTWTYYRLTPLGKAFLAFTRR